MLQAADGDHAVSSGMLYHFEEDAFGSVSELLDWYVRRCKPVTETSGAVASVPVLRAGPSTSTTTTGQSVTTPRSPERPRSVPAVARGFTAVDVVNDGLTSLVVRGPPQRVGSEPLLSPQPPPSSGPRSGGTNVDWLPSAADSKNVLTGSDGDLTRPPPPKPTRLPTIRIGRDERKPLVQIRNRGLYEDDGSDYSDYTQVTQRTREL